MKAKEFIPVSKPRNFVAKNQQTAGAGAHKDKKRAEKQGDVKHKAKQFEEDAVADFLARGGEIQHGKFRKPRKSEKTDYGSKHIGGQRDAVAGKAGKTLGKAAATNFKGGGKPVVGTTYRSEGVSEGDTEWSGSQGNFAGDKPVDLGSTVSKRLDVNDTVSYFGEKATILAMSKDRTVARIDLKSGITQNVKTSDLKRVGQVAAEATSVAVRMQRAADKQRAKSDASLARTPSSIPKKEEPKKS